MASIGSAMPKIKPLKGKSISKAEKDAVKNITALKLQSKGYSKKGSQQIAVGDMCSSAADKSRAVGMIKKSGGGTAAGFPNVCMTPGGGSGPIPIPYPNLGSMGKSGKGSTKKVKLSQKAASATQSSFGKSMGNEAGTLKGLISLINMPPRRKP